ncbi:hypothetical protein [Prevotella pallens]|uniref:hypothetical protein n=1 Tax=Prevotella pallens TaxID=60133 RepID=UPI001CADD391|nr:hypothetical protein [Prevotella pallens]MBF1477245.1 hypothetical protein [Prevotella pallens]
MEMRIWLWKYMFLVTQGYGHDESAPTPNGVFVAHFTDCSLAFCGMFAMFWQSVSNILAIRSQCFGNPSAMFWQTVSSRRGGFIVPAYMKTPTK